MDEVKQPFLIYFSSWHFIVDTAHRSNPFTPGLGVSRINDEDSSLNAELRNAGKIDVYAFVIMPNQIHLIYKTYEFWQRDTLAIHLYGREVAFQKLKIHT